MSYHKLLTKQLNKYLRGDTIDHPVIKDFLSAVNESYLAYDRDKELSERAFRISEEEYIEINHQLKNELEIKKLSAQNLKEAIKEIEHDSSDELLKSDELPEIVAYLKSQINKRKKAEELWQFALEGAGDGVWEYDFQTTAVFFSKKYKQMLGYTDEEFKNLFNEWYSRIHPDDVPLILETDHLYEERKITSHQREYRIMHKNGNYIWVLDRGMVISFSEEGKPKRIIGTHTDITERKLVEQALRINEEKYRNIIANMNLGLIEVDNQDRIQYANNSFCDMSGYPLDELVGKNATLLFASGNSRNLIDQKNEIRREGISDAYEIAVKNKKGEQKWWLISGAPRYNDKGYLIGSIGIHLDITQQKELELELIKARELAEQSARSKDIFLANMSHEIRTPLNAILGMGRQLQKTSLNEQQKFFIDTINSSGEHLLVVINDILDISKIQAGKLHIENIGFRLNEVGDRVLQVMTHKAEEKGIAFSCLADKTTHPVLIGDPYRLNQVLLNLISNAIKFTEKGTVGVKCEVLEDAPGFQRIGFTVTDTGIGMDKEFASRLFQNFSQEDRSTARKYGGTGLGMAISKQLVDLMGGSIHVTSEKGKGTAVHFSIPFKKGTEKDIISNSEGIFDAGLLLNKRILLVEDNEMNRLVASTILESYGLILTEVVNGKEALETLSREPYDLVLMDVQMPVMDGLEATRTIRKEISRELPVIALTANAIKGENDTCFNAGMNDYISKPFKEEDLIATMLKWLTQNKQQNGNR